MAFWTKWFNSEARSASGPVPLSDSQAAAILGKFRDGMVTESGLYGLPAFYACIKVIAETVASLGIGVYEKTNDGRIIEKFDHPAHKLLTVAPAEPYSSFTFRETQQMRLLAHGNAYAKQKRSGSGELREIEMIPPEEVTIYHNKENNTITYKRRNEPIHFADMLHIPAMAINGFAGISPITQMRRTFLLSLASRDYGVEFYNKGTFPSGVVKAPNKLTDAALKRLKESFKEAYSGKENIGNVVFLEENMDFTTISLSPVDARFIEVMQLQLQEIARIYRIPLHMVGDLSRSTNNNIEQQSIDFAVHTIRPWIKRWENELNRKLFNSTSEKNLFVRFNMDSLLRGDSAARAKLYTALWTLGSVNSNEIRRMENFNPREGGDAFYVPANMTEALQSLEKILNDGSKQ